MKEMTLSEELEWRGFVNQTTFKDLKVLDGDPITFYWGVDPSASSMTIGNLAAAMMVRLFIEYGHKAVLLVGGATGLIGDPDGKKTERALQSTDDVASNKASLTQQYKTVFEGQKFEVVDNYDWFKNMNYLDFLRTIGKHLSMTQLLDREFVKNRIGEGGSGISYAEFSYSLIQGYDFLHLFREKGVTLQVCGADQWGNSLSGVEMIRKLEGKDAHVYSTPLVINKSTGIKFGKSESGAIWLDSKLTSPYKFYQFWLNLDDLGVGEYLKFYTSITPDEFDDLMKSLQVAPQERAAQKYLAFEVTKIVHGEATAKNVQAISEVLFGAKDFNELTKAEVEELATEILTVETESILEALTDGGLASSNSEARRFVESGAITINGQKVTQESTLSQFHKNNGYQLMKRGKNSFILIR